MAFTLQMEPGSSVTVGLDGCTFEVSTDAVWAINNGIIARTRDPVIVKCLADLIAEFARQMADSPAETTDA